MEIATNAKTKFEITEAMIEQATSYIPLADKVAFAKLVAPDCIEKVDMSIQKAQSDSTLTLPQMWEEQPLLKKLYLLHFFLKNYLHIDTPDKFNHEVYDSFAGEHPLCQLERMKYKASTAIKDKVYNILADFRDVTRILEAQIHSELEHRNDPLERFLAGVTLLSSSENIKVLLEELKEKSGELTEKLKIRAGKHSEADKLKQEAKG